MSFQISEEYYPILDWEGRTTQEGPKITPGRWVIARWESQTELPTTTEIRDAIQEMQVHYPGRHEDYRIMGLPKPGDRIFGVEVA